VQKTTMTEQKPSATIELLKEIRRLREVAENESAARIARENAELVRKKSQNKLLIAGVIFFFLLTIAAAQGQALGQALVMLGISVLLLCWLAWRR
jgi:hypothetical protein